MYVAVRPSSSRSDFYCIDLFADYKISSDYKDIIYKADLSWVSAVRFHSELKFESRL